MCAHQEAGWAADPAGDEEKRGAGAGVQGTLERTKKSSDSECARCDPTSWATCGISTPRRRRAERLPAGQRPGPAGLGGEAPPEDTRGAPPASGLPALGTGSEENWPRKGTPAWVTPAILLFLPAEGSGSPTPVPPGTRPSHSGDGAGCEETPGLLGTGGCSPSKGFQTQCLEEIRGN